MSSISKDYVFTKKNERLEFVGDFDGLYENDENPWGQNGSDKRLGEYYQYSRNNILKSLKEFSKHKEMLEIGCGLGFVVDFINKSSDFICDGADISDIAIQKAKSNFPKYNFLNFDIKMDNIILNKKYDIVILNQVLWYVLDKFENVFENIFNMLKDNGLFIISNAFMQLQGYGKDIIDGFGGLIQYIENQQEDKFKIKEAILSNKDKLLYKDGCVVMEKVNG